MTTRLADIVTCDQPIGHVIKLTTARFYINPTDQHMSYTSLYPQNVQCGHV